MTFNRSVKLFALFACAILVSCNERPSYFGMLRKNDVYYFRLAKSCDELLQNTNYTSMPTIIRGNDPSLPELLKKLHATKIEIEKHPFMDKNDNRLVAIIFGAGRPQYIIWWGRADYGHGYRPWQLAIAGEGVGKAVYSTTNITSMRQTPP